jgi:Fic family protein
VWIGSPTDSPQNAVFVPPFEREMNAAWRDWEDFANSEPRLPLLVQCALMHYQFEQSIRSSTVMADLAASSSSSS